MALIWIYNFRQVSAKCDQRRKIKEGKIGEKRRETRGKEGVR